MSSRRSVAEDLETRALTARKEKGTTKAERTARNCEVRQCNDTGTTSSARRSAANAPLIQVGMTAKIDSMSIESALEARFQILASVSEEKNHVYCNFARHMSLRAAQIAVRQPTMCEIAL